MTDAFTPDDAERLLGGLAGDSPLGAALDGLRALAHTAAPDVGLVVPQMTVAAAGGSGWLGYAWLFRPRGLLLAKLVTAAAATSAAVTGGVAATGHLPAPIQRVVAEAADRVGINIPGGDSPTAPAPLPRASSATTTTSTTSTTSSTTTTSTSTSTTTTTTTTLPITTTTVQGPGRCTQLDATIVRGSAILTPVPGNPAVVSLRMEAHTTGQVDEVSALIGSVGTTPLEETSNGVWTATIELPSTHQQGEQMKYTAIGCGFDELELSMQQETP